MNRQEPPIAEQLRAKLTDLRRLGLRDDEIVAETGLSRAQVWRYRNGAASSPSWDSVQAIERVCAKKLGSQDE
jgi:hypothetical protein